MPYTRSRKRIGRIRPIKKRKRRSVPAQQSRDEPIIEYLEDIKGTTAIPNAADINHSRECNENSELWKKLGITIERYDDESDAEEVSNVKGMQKSINEGNEILNEDKDRNRIKYENIRINIVNTNTSITGFSLEEKGEVIPFSDNQIVVKTEILDDSEFNSAHQSKYDDHFLGKEVVGNTYMYEDTPKLCLTRETDNVIEYKTPNYETDNLCVRIKSEPIENGNPSQASSEEQLDNSYHTTEKKLHGSAELHLDNCRHATEKPLQGCSELQLDNICHRTEIKIELDDTNIVNGTMDKHQIDWVIRQSEPYRDGEDEVVSVIPAVGEENDIAVANVDDRGDATIPGLQRLHTHCKPSLTLPEPVISTHYAAHGLLDKTQQHFNDNETLSFDWKRHICMINEHPIDDQDELIDRHMVKCQFPDCGWSFSTKAKLKIHIQLVHISPCPSFFKCNIEGCTFFSYASDRLVGDIIREHVHEHNALFSLTFNPICSSFFVCVNCNYITLSHSEMLTHRTYVNGCRFNGMLDGASNTLSDDAEDRMCLICRACVSENYYENHIVNKHSIICVHEYWRYVRGDEFLYTLDEMGPNSENTKTKLTELCFKKETIIAENESHSVNSNIALATTPEGFSRLQRRKKEENATSTDKSHQAVIATVRKNAKRKVLYCPYTGCNERFRSAVTLRDHCTSNHLVLETEKLPFVCRIGCGKRFLHKSVLKRHQISCKFAAC